MDLRFPLQSSSYNVHRWYQPATGRFTIPDPETDLPLFHSYGYAGNRPLDWIDPDGKKPTLPRLPPTPLYIPREVPCVDGYVSEAFFRGSLGPNGNRWAHRFASCGINKCAGQGAAENLGLKKEVSPRAGPS